MFEPQTKYGNDQAPNPNAVTTVVAPGATPVTTQATQLR